jgi:hypothetical protein
MQDPWRPGACKQERRRGPAVHGAWGVTPVGFWTRPRLPLIAGEQTSPLEALMLLADAQSGMGVPLDQPAAGADHRGRDQGLLLAADPAPARVFLKAARRYQRINGGGGGAGGGSGRSGVKGRGGGGRHPFGRLERETLRRLEGWLRSNTPGPRRR